MSSSRLLASTLFSYVSGGVPIAQRYPALRARACTLQSWVRYATDTSQVIEYLVRTHRELLEICVPGHSHRAEALHNLGAALFLRFRECGDPDDLQESIQYLRACLRDNPDDEATIEAVACSLITSYEEWGNSQDIEEAVQQLSKLHLGMSKHAFKPIEPATHYVRIHIPYTARGLRILCQHPKCSLDLEEALDRVKSNYQATSTKLERCHALVMLTTLIRIKYLRDRDMSKISAAFVAINEALEISTTHICKDRARTLSEAAILHLTPGVPEYDLKLALKYLLEALRDDDIRPEQRVMDALEVFSLCSARVIFPSPGDTMYFHVRDLLLEAYRETVGLLSQVASVALDVRSRVKVLAKVKTLAAQGATQAILFGLYFLAVEMIEAGRAIIWTQSPLHREARYNSLPAPHSQNLIKLSRALDTLMIEDSTFSPREAIPSSYVEMRKFWRRRICDRIHVELNRVRPKSINPPTSIPNPLRTLLRTAKRGPVVLLIASARVCYALLIDDQYSTPRRITLEGVTEDWLETLATSLKVSNEIHRNAIRGMNRGPIPHSTSKPQLSEMQVLEVLWTKVMRLVVRRLSLKSDATELQVKYGFTSGMPLNNRLSAPLYFKPKRKRHRLFICPTGAFMLLPLHAAGLHGRPGQTVSDHFIVSYTPSLTALTFLRDQHTPLPRTEARVLLAAVPDPVHGGALPFATEEVAAIMSVIPEQAIICLRSNEVVANNVALSSDTLLRCLPQASMLHLACHGIQDALDPVSSGFMMQDKMVTVRDFMSSNIHCPHAFFAFLSACETAKGDSEQPDQSICLSTAMLYAGFKSIVGTMWRVAHSCGSYTTNIYRTSLRSMDDIDGPLVAKMVYQRLFAGEAVNIDPEVVPHALDDAVRALKSLGLPPSRWACYVHIGI
jgi:hypothetical protein